MCSGCAWLRDASCPAASGPCVQVTGECATFLLTGLVAAFVPSLRASRVEPSEALRHE